MWEQKVQKTDISQIRFSFKDEQLSNNTQISADQLKVQYEVMM